jgi:hypothetical protein
MAAAKLTDRATDRNKRLLGNHSLGPSFLVYYYEGTTFVFLVLYVVLYSLT